MKSLIMLLAICSLGYVVDHWQELTERHSMAATSEAPGLILYSSKSQPACVQLEAELKRKGISFKKCDLDVAANRRELTDKLARVGKMGGSIPMPVVEINGVLHEGVTFEQVVRLVH